MFAIDTTGSMAGEINAAKAIATSIINMQRQFDVDYILSPFNDPGESSLINDLLYDLLDMYSVTCDP